jgi:hypothetical protein
LTGWYGRPPRLGAGRAPGSWVGLAPPPTHGGCPTCGSARRTRQREKGESTAYEERTVRGMCSPWDLVGAREGCTPARPTRPRIVDPREFLLPCIRFRNPDQPVTTRATHHSATTATGLQSDRALALTGGSSFPSTKLPRIARAASRIELQRMAHEPLGPTLVACVAGCFTPYVPVVRALARLSVSRQPLPGSL